MGFGEIVNPFYLLFNKGRSERYVLSNAVSVSKRFLGAETAPELK